MSAACTRTVHGFAIFCKLYSNLLSVTFEREQLHVTVCSIVLTNDLPCKKIGSLDEEVFFLVHIHLVLLAVHFSIDCKY